MWGIYFLGGAEALEKNQIYIYIIYIYSDYWNNWNINGNTFYWNDVYYILYHVISMGITIRISILGGLSKGKPSIVIHVSIVSL